MHLNTRTIWSAARCRAIEEPEPRDMRPFLARLEHVRALGARDPDAALPKARMLLEDVRSFGRDPAGFVRYAALRRAAVNVAGGRGSASLAQRERLACSLEAQAQVAEGVEGFRPRVLEALAEAALQVRWVGLDLDERMAFLADLAATCGLFRQWAAAELDMDGASRLALELLVLDSPREGAARLLLEAAEPFTHPVRAKCAGNVPGRSRRMDVHAATQGRRLVDQSPQMRCLRRSVGGGLEDAVASKLLDQMAQALACASGLTGEADTGVALLESVYTAVADPDLGWALLPAGMDQAEARASLEQWADQALDRAAGVRNPAIPVSSDSPKNRPLAVSLGLGLGELGFLDRESGQWFRRGRGLDTVLPRAPRHEDECESQTDGLPGMFTARQADPSIPNSRRTI